jgi:hypothetical protein
LVYSGTVPSTNKERSCPFSTGRIVLYYEPFDR